MVRSDCLSLFENKRATQESLLSGGWIHGIGKPNLGYHLITLLFDYFQTVYGN